MLPMLKMIKIYDIAIEYLNAGSQTKRQKIYVFMNGKHIPKTIDTWIVLLFILSPMCNHPARPTN